MFRYSLFKIYIFKPLLIFLWSTNILEHMHFSVNNIYLYEIPLEPVRIEILSKYVKIMHELLVLLHCFNVKSKESDHMDFKPWFWYSMIQHKSTLNQSACRTNEVLIMFEQTRSRYIEIIFWKEFNIISQLLFFLLNFGLQINLENYVTFEEIEI